jgi:hypothetical protein
MKNSRLASSADLAGIENRSAYLLLSFAFTSAIFCVIYWQWGFYFESADALIFFCTKVDVTSPDVPVNYNNYLFLFTPIYHLQSLLPQVPVFGLFTTICLFVPILIINYHLISNRKFSRANLFIALIIVVLLSIDNLININNSRISILLLTAYGIILLKSKSLTTHFLSLPLLILACLVRVEYGIIFTFIISVGFFLLKLNVGIYKIITTTIISIFALLLLAANLEKSDPYAASVFKLEREFLEKKNVKPISETDPDFIQKQVFQQALSCFLEDRDNILEQDFLEEIAYPNLPDYFLSWRWVDNYKVRLLELSAEFLRTPFFLLLWLLSISISFTNASKRHFLFLIIITALPFFIMLQADMVSRFYVPYICSFALVSLVTNDHLTNTRRWLFIIFLAFISLPVMARHAHNTSIPYRIQHERFCTLDSFYQDPKNENKKIIHANFFYDFLITPKVFYTKDISQQYFISFSFWHYYESLRARRAEVFSNQSCILSNLIESSNQEHTAFISTEEYLRFLKNYLLYFHNYHLHFSLNQILVKDLGYYNIHLEEHNSKESVVDEQSSRKELE